MLTSIRNAFVILMLLVNYSLFGQYLDINDGANITNMEGDEFNAEWSPDGNMLLFQSTVNNRNNIYIYQLDKDTLLHFSNNDFNFRNPIWHPDGDKIVFDSDINGSDFLYTIDLISYSVLPLFNRKIYCKDATFSTMAKLIYFTGFDDVENRWCIYSYDFVYDNLNKLTSVNNEVENADIDKSGKLLVYCVKDLFRTDKHLNLMNWYGEPVASFDEFKAENPSWGPDGLKIYFVSSNNGEVNELYSIWKDGSHLEKITDLSLGVKSPTVSPNGTKIALSIQTEKGWDIMVIPFEDY